MKRVKVNFNFKSMALALFALVLSSNVWGAIDANSTWTATALKDIPEGSTVIICSSNGKAINNADATSGGPTKIAMTFTSSTKKISVTTTGKSLDDIVWTTSKTTNGTRFWQYGSTTKLLGLNGTSSNTAVRVTTSTSASYNEFVMGSNGKLLKYYNASRYIGEYVSGSDFRSYNSETAANYSSSSLTFYVMDTPSKTLSSITVKTAPSKVTYTEGDKFDPTGLVITKNYSDNSTEDWAYASHASDFTFSPSTSTALTTSNKSVTITVGGKSTTQSITVNAKPKYTVTFYNAGEVVKTVSNVTEGTLFSVIKPTIGTGSGQLNIESCDNSSTHFMGWTTEEPFQKRGSAPSYVADGKAINSNMELRAVWAAEQQ